MAQRIYTSFTDFWPFYLREHGRRGTRIFHYVGTGLGFLCLGWAVAQGEARWLLGMPLAGYFFAWLSHALIEHNRPATFTYPVWSLLADYRMFFLALAGRLGPELQKAGAGHPKEP